MTQGNLGAMIGMKPKLQLSRLTRFSGIFLGVKRPKVDVAGIDADVRLPLALPLRERDAYSSTLALVLQPLITAIRGMVNVAQVRPNVVPTVAIDVVNFTGWPFARLQRKSNSVAHVETALKPNPVVTLLARAASNLANLSAVCRSLLPAKFSAVGAVRNVFSKYRNIDSITFSHIAPHLRFWLGLPQRSSAAGPAFSIPQFTISAKPSLRGDASW